MGDNYIKQGGVVQPIYESRKLTTGLTVQGNGFRPNGTGGYVSTGYSNPIAFTEIGTSGRYTAEITAPAVNGWHFIEIDATSPGDSRPSIYKFRVEDNEIQEIYDLAAVIDGKIDAIQGAGFVTGDDSLEALSNRQVDMQGPTFNPLTDNLEEIRDAIAAAQTSIDNIQGAVTAQIVLESSPELEIPDTGFKRYRLLIRNYNVDGGMQDFDAAPSVAVDAEGTNISGTTLFDARTAGSATTTAAQVGAAGSGTYEIFFHVSSTDLPSALVFTVTGDVSAVTKTFHHSAERVAESTGDAQEATLTEIKQTTAGAYDRDTDSLEAIRDFLTATRTAIEGATFNTATDSLEAIRDNQTVFQTKTAGTFDRDTMSLEALSEKIEESIVYGDLGAH